MCDQPSIDINPIFIPSDANIIWAGPGGFNTVQPNISVSIPGDYTLNVTNQAGCTTSRTVDIGIDTSTFPVNVVNMGKNCQNSYITLGNDPELLSLWQWNGPNGFSSNYYRPNVTDPGIYILTGTYSNGCTRLGTFFFDGDFSIPDISISPRDTLNCNELLSMTVSSLTAGASYSWSGPLGFSSAQSTVQTNQEGVYTGIVTAPNGCQNSAPVIVDKGDDIFDFKGFKMVKGETDEVLNASMPKIILAGSGMFEGGKIGIYLKKYLSNPLATLLIVSFQVDGSLGRKIINGERKIKVDNKEIEINAKISTIFSFSSHSDHGMLFDWAVKANPKKIFVVHGEEPASQFLAESINGVVPDYNTLYNF